MRELWHGIACAAREVPDAAMSREWGVGGMVGFGSAARSGRRGGSDPGNGRLGARGRLGEMPCDVGQVDEVAGEAVLEDSLDLGIVDGGMGARVSHHDVGECGAAGSGVEAGRGRRSKSKSRIRSRTGRDRWGQWV